jgi:type IV secretion system protein VirD4
MRNYAGHRLAPWLAHVMVSRQETARALLTPGEVMQLPPAEELVLVSGHPPVRATKLRYFEDANFRTRVLPAPALSGSGYSDLPPARANDWQNAIRFVDVRLGAEEVSQDEDSSGGLEQVRHPGHELETAAPMDCGLADALGLGADDEDIAADQRTMDQARSAATSRGVFAMDAPSAESDDLRLDF